MTLIEKFIEKAKLAKKKVVFPEGADERIQKSAEAVSKAGIAKPVLLGRKEEILSSAGMNGADISACDIIEPETSPDLPELTELYCANRKNVKPRVAEKLVKKDLVFGGMLLASGRVDAMIAGAANTTASVIQASALTVGYQKGISTPSSFFIMALPGGKTLFYADCAVNIDPDYKQLAEIGVATSVSYAKIMGEKPRTAFLSFSTKGSASHPLVEKVQKAVCAAKEISVGSDMMIDGEFQGDTALVEAVAKKKIKEPSSVAGQANILIFPDLNAGNIAYKLTQYLAGAGAFGPVLQGFAKPVSDLSRGAKVEDIVGITAITCC
ncbi:MAG: phosphotransacetylase, partial [Candidatus Omnitrophica bacterium]|nr:phosphotransacetylase [Candidatus Omnitrophota bacterium]